MAALIPVNTLGVNAWPFSVSQNFTQVCWNYCFEICWIFSFHATFLELFTLHSVALLLLFVWAFCSISSSCSLFKSELWLEKSWSSILKWNLQLVQNYKVKEVLAGRNSHQLWHWNGILRISLAKRSCLISLQPIKNRAANEFSVRHLPFGSRNSAFYRAQLVIWARVLIIRQRNAIAACSLVTPLAMSIWRLLMTWQPISSFLHSGVTMLSMEFLHLSFLIMPKRFRKRMKEFRSCFRS